MFDLCSFKDRIACITPSGEHYSYGDLYNMTMRIQEHLEAHQLVFCLCGNNIASVSGYISFINNDNPVLLLDAHIDKSSFDFLYEVYKPMYIWAPEDSGLELNTEIVYREKSYCLYKFETNSTRVSNELALLLTTSGSTGSPKLVRLSKKNIESNARSIIDYLHITANERPVTSLPMYYSFGLSIINSHLLAGATLLLTEASFIERDFWQFAKQYGFTSFSGVPYTFEILKKMKFCKQSFPTLRTLTQAGGKLSNELLRFFIETVQPHKVDLYLMYGQTEATARMSYLEPKYGLSKLGSIGKCIPGGTFSLIDDNGNIIVGPDVIGELVYTGDNVSLGYAECVADLIKEDENHGVLHTGDFAYRDSEGFYFITGRKNRFLKLFGNRVNLDYLETLLKPMLADCACVGNDSKLIIYTSDTDFNENGIIDFIVTRTKIIRTTFSVRHIDQIPRSEAGKIKYKDLIVD